MEKIQEYCTYIWKDPKSGVPRYVGEGECPKRPFMHFRLKTQLGNMLRKRVREGYDPQPIIIRASSKEDGQEMEVLLIAMCGRLDLGTGTLFNHTDGADGIPGFTHGKETIEKFRVLRKEMWKRPGFRENQSEKQRAANKARYAKPGTREVTGDALTAYYLTPGALEKHAAAQQASYDADPDRKALISKPCTVDGITIYPTVIALIAALGQGKGGRRSPHFRHASTELVEQRGLTIDAPPFISTLVRKPCTVDGITIYPSRRALVAALGENKTGARSPNFRYVSAELIEPQMQILPSTTPNHWTKKTKCCTVDGITIYPSRRALAAVLGNGKQGVNSPTFRYVEEKSDENGPGYK
jgi:hypothetical protein